MASEQPSLLADAIGPYAQIWNNLPPEQQAAAAGGAVILAGAGYVLYHLYEKAEDKNQLEATDWEERMDDLIKLPVSRAGSPEDILLVNQATSAGKRTIGKVKKAMNSETGINSHPLQEAVDELDDVEIEDLDPRINAVTYEVLPGRTKLDRFFNSIMYYLYKMVSDGSNPAADYYDLPADAVEVTDRGIIVKNDVHIIKQNGLFQTANWKHQERIAQLSHLGVHQNWLESLQKHPEFYSDLNMDVSGKKNVMNQKSENMREYKKSERQAERMEAAEK